MSTTPLSKLDDYELVNKDQDIRGWQLYDQWAAGGRMSDSKKML